jgi:uncharacterized protein (TIGR01777 family)
MEKILITGGTGLVGWHLAAMLIHKGYEVAMLSRNAGEKNGIKLHRWDVKKGEIDHTAFHGVNHVVHLAGAGVADHRWTDSYKKEIYDSRIRSTRLLYETVMAQNVPLNSFVSASATGIYGINVKGIAKEDDAPATDFLATVCEDWEAEAAVFAEAGIRTVMIRTGIVLAKNEGFISRVSAPVKWFAGAPLGTGKQMISWIHIDDLCSIYIKAIEDAAMNGPYNAVSPNPVSNREITHEIAKRLNRPILLPPVPRFVLRILLVT